MDSSEFVKIAQDAVIGAYYTTVAGPVDQFPAARAFSERYQERFDKKPESYALYGYDSAYVFIKALQDFVTENPDKIPTRAEVGAAVRDVAFDGITGSIAFDDKGDRLRSDYYVIKFEEATYPGKTIKAIAASPSGD
jgi:branched-chain amino acid transport system substrate-binding protein